MALFGCLVYRASGDGGRRWATIGADYKAGGRGVSFWVKPNGGMWALPEGACCASWARSEARSVGPS